MPVSASLQELWPKMGDMSMQHVSVCMVARLHDLSLHVCVCVFLRVRACMFCLFVCVGVSASVCT